MIVITNRTSIFMEQIPKIRFSQFDNKWNSILIGNLAKIKRGASPRPIQNPKWFDENSDIGWLRISDVTEQNGRIKYLEQKISKLGQEKTRVLNTPHLLLSIAATVGKPVVNYVKTGVHDGFLIFENPKFDREFMFQWFDMFRPKWNKYGQPGSQVNLNSDIIRNHKMMIPSLPEQFAIGSLFRTLDDLLASYKDNLANYQSLKATMLSKMFPKAGQTVPEIRLDGFEGEWKLYELKSRTEIITKGTTPKDKSWQGEVNYIKTESINRDTGSLVRTASTSLEEHLGYLKRSILKEGDVLFSIVGTLGVVGIVDKKDLPANTNQQIAIIRLKRDDAIFMLNFLKSPRIKSFIKSDSTIGAQPSLSLWQIEKIKVSFPSSLEEQQAIGSYFSSLDQLITSYQEKITQLETLKKKLLQDMFI
jgi:type I restriction enzyme, S subunit